MSKQIAVLAAGAIGSLVGAELTRAGHDVLLIDQWPAHVEAIKANGLQLTMLRTGEQATFRVKIIHLCDLASLKPRFDLVFLVCKAYDSRWMAELIKPYLKNDGALVPVQNGMTDEQIAPIVGPERDIACCLELGADITEPGQVRRNMPREGSYLAFGELDGKITPRVKELADMMSPMARTEVKSNIWGTKLAKLVCSTSGSTARPIFGTRHGQMLDNPEYKRFTIRLGTETVRVGMAAGYSLEPALGLDEKDFEGTVEEKVEKLVTTLASDVGKEGREGAHGFVGTVMRDLLNGRRTETDDFNGWVVRKGRALNIPTPINETICSLMKEIEQGKREFRSLSNFRFVEQYAR